MRLLQHTGRYFLLFACFALPAGIGLLYFTLRRVVDQEQDELLQESAAGMVRQWTTQGLPADTVLALADDILEIRPAPPTLTGPTFRDVRIWNADEQEAEPGRQYQFITPPIGGRRYDVTMTHSILDSEELLFSALVAIIGLVVLLLAAVLWFHRFVARRLWQPFHDTLAALAAFNFSGQTALALPEHTAVTEFNDLNRAANAMTHRIADDYQSMRAFTGNAAHEIQTPLAVIQSKAELLLQDAELDEATLTAVADIHRTAYRLARLNRALLFLHKIENQQFREATPLNLGLEINEKLVAYAEHLQAKSIHLTTDLADAILPMHAALA
ncbi:MAG: histidine kinase dimerization/phospho-acceptor domain-containing protein, partial [Saprospiraceae bacterium]